MLLTTKTPFTPASSFCLFKGLRPQSPLTGVKFASPKLSRLVVTRTLSRTQNVMDWVKDTNNEKIHPTQKPVSLLKALIQIFTDEGDVVIDPVAGSGSTLVAAIECNRKAFGFEIKKDFYAKAKAWIECNSSYLIHQIRPDRLRRLLHPAHLPSH